MNPYLLSVLKGERNSFFALLITYLLLPWTLIYALGVFCHRNFYRLRGAYKAPKPVISIGNITVGGTGKTPLVIWLARHLQDKGYKSVILTRGYMASGAKDSDEADMFNEQIPYIPVLKGADRVANIKKSLGVLPVDVFICDDAFQHWPLRRDLNIVTIDAVNPFGRGYLLPAGILREGLSALKRADVIVLTKTDGTNNVQALSAKLKKINARALIVESLHKGGDAVDVFGKDALPVDFLKNIPVAGFCAIGDPVSFVSELKNSGARIMGVFTYRDHHIYHQKDIQGMVDFCRAQTVPILVTTHKDAVKLHKFKGLFNGLRLVYIPIQLEITKGSDEFIQKIVSACRG
ncbi:MAG: tetraacyldisaccharide 4'-kinase [Candidatus Omnitrophica bacterium]|nr:tetraacyldisaccharide 4'-kinase [Candidatus Omnitrophota bacterium]